jgi:formate transporter
MESGAGTTAAQLGVKRMTDPASRVSDDDTSPTPRRRVTTKPNPQYLSAEHVLEEMCAFGSSRLERLSVAQLFLLGVIGGAFITAGALFSVLLSDGLEMAAAKHVLAGLGFSAGFFFVILSHAALFTEANVVLPAVLLYERAHVVAWKIARYWAIVWLGNLVGAIVVGWAIVSVQDYGAGPTGELAAFIEKKSAYAAAGTAAAWGQAVISGVLANWLVGMAAFFAVMGRTIVGKYVPVALAVTLFVAANFQHSPANMGYFGLATPLGIGPGWPTALLWNIIPAGIGNMLGGALLVALPFWFALHPEHRESAAANARAAARDSSSRKDAP